MMGGTGAANAHAMRATEAKRARIDQARLDDLERRAEGKTRRRKKSALFAAVAGYNVDAAEASAPGPEKRKHSSPQKSAGRQTKKSSGSGSAGGVSRGIFLPAPSNKLEYTPASALKTMMTHAPTPQDKPGPVIAAMLANDFVPVSYKTLTGLRSKKIKDPKFVPQ